MWKEYLKKVIPALRHRPTVLRLHRLADALRGIPARARLTLAGRPRVGAAALAGRGKRIVFVADNPLRREPKFAYALKRAGWDVILLTAKLPRFDTTDFAEVQTYTSSWEALELARKTRSPLFHNFTASFDEASVRLVDDKPGRVIFDFYDYFFALSDGLPVREHHEVEIETQTYCIARADALCVPDIQLQYRRRETKVARGKPIIHFPNYCWNRQMLPETRQEGPPRIVQIGWMHFEKDGDADLGCFRAIKEFVDAGCEFTIIMHPGFPQVGTARFRHLFSDYLELASSTGRLTFHPTIPSHLLVQKLTSYDFGFNMISGSTYDLPWAHHNPAWLPLLASGRMYDYLDAGLATLSDANLDFNRHLFGRAAFIDGTRLVREGHIYQSLCGQVDRKRMERARAGLAVERHIHRLACFYESLS
jgi:hypothetical protein